MDELAADNHAGNGTAAGAVQLVHNPGRELPDERAVSIRHRLLLWPLARLYGSMTLQFLRNRSPFELAVSAIVAGCLIWLMIITIVVRRPTPTVPQVSNRDVFQQIDSCVKELTSPYEIVPVGDEAMTYAQVGCVNYVRAQYALLDYNIRRADFTEQRVATVVLLWMVVTITISGVAMAALQLVTAYRMATQPVPYGPTINTTPATAPAAELSSAGTSAAIAPVLPGSQAAAVVAVTQALGSDLQLEAGKISLRTSVTGVLILAVSLAFFTVFVKFVLPIKEIGPEKPETKASVSSAAAGSAGVRLLSVQGRVADSQPTQQATANNGVTGREQQTSASTVDAQAPRVLPVQGKALEPKPIPPTQAANDGMSETQQAKH